MTEESKVAVRAHRRVPRWWVVTLIALLAGYAALTVFVVVRSPLGDLDRFLYHAKLAPKHSPWHTPLLWWIWIGQGVPCSTLAALYAIRRSLVTRSWSPWVMFCLALIALNVSVGAMKHATGRLGPSETNKVYTVLSGGTIYPSGHTANAVVMYGLIAMLVPLAHRKLMTIIATFIATTVALGTVMIRTHWISDVFGGWIAGVLVLQLAWLLTPWATGLVERAADRVLPVLARWWAAIEYHQSPTTPSAAGRALRAGASGTVAPSPTATASPIVAEPTGRAGAESAPVPPVHTGVRPPEPVPDRHRVAQLAEAHDTHVAAARARPPHRPGPVTPRPQRTVTIPDLRQVRRRRSSADAGR